MLNKQLKRELKYLIPVAIVFVYGFHLLSLLDEPKHIEWGSWVVKAQEQPLEAISEPQKYNVNEWGILADGYEDVIDEINKVWGEDNYIGLRIAYCESRFGRNRIHTNTDGSHDISVFQINDRWHSHRGDILNWRENIRIAYEIYKEQGGRPWVCYNLYSYDW